MTDLIARLGDPNRDWPEFGHDRREAKDRIEGLVKERDAYVEQLMVDANTFSEMHLEIEQLRNKISEMQARINRLTLGGDRR